MTNDIEAIRLKLKSATKLKLNMERNVCQTRNRERSFNDQLAIVKAEIEFSKEQLEDVKTQMSQARHQISIIEICSTSERSKIDAHVANLGLHVKGFQQIFDKERVLFDKRMKETQDKEAKEDEVQRQRDKEIAKKNEEEAKQAAAINVECDALERECAVLKKRNNAIMLQLRRKLLETENARREHGKINPKNL